MPIIRAAGRRPILDVRNPAVAALRGGSTHTRASVHLHDGTVGASTLAGEPRRRASDARAFATAAGRPVRDSGANIHGVGGACDGSGGDDRLAARDAAFDRLIDRAVFAICEGGSRADRVFGPYAALNSLVRPFALQRSAEGVWSTLSEPDVDDESLNAFLGVSPADWGGLIAASRTIAGRKWVRRPRQGSQPSPVACCRFRGHRDKVFDGTGELECREGSSAASSSLRQ